MRRFLIKLGIGLCGLALLIKFGSIDLSAFSSLALRPGLVILAFFALLLTAPLASWRWCLLMRALGFKLTFAWTVNVTFISQFFNTFMPGAYGGDLVRVALTYRATNRGLSRIVFSVATDRLTGLLALMILGVAMIPSLPNQFGERLEWVAMALATVGVAGVALLILAGEQIVSLIAKLPAPVGPAVGKFGYDLMAALRAYMRHPGILLLAIGISLTQYLLVLGALFALGEAMLFKGLSLSGYVVAGVWALISSALPITPGGMGIGEAAFNYIAQAMTVAPVGSEGFGSIFLAMRMITIIIGLFGLVPLLVGNSDVSGSVELIKHNDANSTEDRSR